MQGAPLVELVQSSPGTDKAQGRGALGRAVVIVGSWEGKLGGRRGGGR